MDTLFRGKRVVEEHPMLRRVLDEIESERLYTPSLDSKGKAHTSAAVNDARAMAYVKFSK